MSEQENLDLINRIYGAFGAGDIPGLLGMLAEDIDWFHPRPDQIPWGGARTGHEEVVGFFTALGQAVDVERFEPGQFVAKDDQVIVFGGERMKVKSNGVPYEVDWTHVFTVRDGKVAKFREYTDTAGIINALNAA